MSHGASDAGVSLLPRNIRQSHDHTRVLPSSRLSQERRGVRSRKGIVMSVTTYLDNANVAFGTFHKSEAMYSFIVEPYWAEPRIL